MLAMLDRVNVGFAKLEMLKDLGMSEAAYATGAGIFFVGYLMFEVPSNILLKRFGARTWIARIMISWGTISSAMMFVRGEWGFYIMRFLLGFAEAGFFPGIIFYLTLWYPSRLRSTKTALFVSAIAVSGMLGNPISGLIMHKLSGAAGLAGWQWLFLAEGIPSILVGVWVFFYLDSSIAEAKWLSVDEKEFLAKNLEAEDRCKHRVRLLEALKCGKVYALCSIYFMLMIASYFISFWLPTVVQGFGVNKLNTGLITAIPYAVALVGMILLSRNSDRTGERRIHYVFNVMAGGIGLVLSGIFAAHPVLVIIFLSIGTLGVYGSMPLFWPVPSSFLAGTAAAAGIGVVNSVGNLGGYFGSKVPIWVGSISSDPWAARYAIAAALFASAVLAYVFIPDNLAIQPSPSTDAQP